MTLQWIHGGAKDFFSSQLEHQWGVRGTGQEALYEPPTSTLAEVGWNEQFYFKSLNAQI